MMKLKTNEITDLLTLVGTAIAGGYISSMLINMPKAADGVTPSLPQTTRALIQLAGGAVVALVVPGKGIMKILKVMGAGTAVAGGLDLAENVLTLKMLAGPKNTPRRLTPEMTRYIQSGGRTPLPGMSGPMRMGPPMNGPVTLRQMQGNPAFMGRNMQGNPAFMGRAINSPAFAFKASN